MGVSVPTGAHPFQNSPGPAALGSGFWGVTSSLFAVRQTDPAVVFGGIGYSHQFDRSFLGIDFDPGESIFYQLGAGFSVNTELTFTTTFQGGYQFKLRANDIEIPNSAQEPLSLRFAMVMTHCKSYVIEPFVNFGSTPDESDADFGVIVTRTRQSELTAYRRVMQRNAESTTGCSMVPIHALLQYWPSSRYSSQGAATSLVRSKTTPNPRPVDRKKEADQTPSKHTPP